MFIAMRIEFQSHQMQSIRTTNNKKNNREEIVNAVTHGIGVCLAIAGFVIMMVKAEAETLPGFVVYGTSLMLLYLASTLYHSASHPRTKLLFKKLDHIAIFILIAGTYTPFCLNILQGWLSWTLLAVVWGLALLGILFKALHAGRKDAMSLVFYIATGWLAVAAIKPIYHAMSVAGFFFLIGGGIFYSTGVIFYVSSRIRYNHAIWHLFVLAGSSFHFFSVMTLSR
jgi:hemolysin III